MAPQAGFFESGQALNESGPAYRLPVSHLEAISALVIDMTNAISGRQGYVPKN